MGILQTILIILLIYYVLVLLTRWLAPKILQYAAKRTEQRFHDLFQQYNQESDADFTTRKQEDRKKVKKNDDIVGEYIDFEEIE